MKTNKIEVPGKMVSTITENKKELIIMTPKRKNWFLITILALYTSVIIFAQINFIYNIELDNYITIVLILAIGIPFIVIYLLVKYLLWNLFGMQIMRVSASIIEFTKKAPLTSKTKKYSIGEVKKFRLLDNGVFYGSLAVIQFLGIRDELVLTFEYGFKTVNTISGIDRAEIHEIIEQIEKWINKNYAQHKL